MNTIWVFGCSFSSGHSGVPQEGTYGNLLARDLKYNIKNTSSQGASNDIIFYRFNQNLNKFKDGDIILYQFTSFNRIGFFEEEDEGTYFSTAGLPEFGIGTKRIEGPFSNKTDRELEVLIDYILMWQPKRYKLMYNDAMNVINFLIGNKKIKIYTLYLLDEFNKNDKNSVLLPTSSEPNNTSMNQFFMENKLTVYDDDPIKYNLDTHPNSEGHFRLKEILKEKING